MLTCPSSQQGSPLDDVVEDVWNEAGGDRDEIRLLVDVLKACGLAGEVNGLLRRTTEGDQVVRSLRQNDRTTLGVAIIRGGIMHDQARYLIESSAALPNGDLSCEHRVVRTGAPQLLGMLEWWEIEASPTIVIPRALVEEMTTVWALLPPPPETPTWVRERQEIGNRAEMYTVQFERRSASSPGNIAWVSQDASLGWDVEDRGGPILRRIEVKGSRATDPIFFFSDNEWRKAMLHGEHYEVHFWGRINLARSPASEYQALLAAGYPLIVRNIAGEVNAGRWVAVATQWRISLAAASSPSSSSSPDDVDVAAGAPPASTDAASAVANPQARPDAPSEDLPGALSASVAPEDHEQGPL